MSYQAVFQRYEMKYLLTRRQKEAVLRAMEPTMALDAYGRTVIRNLYFDTDTYRLVRHSIEKPAYKEKLRVRSYRRLRPEEDAFVELKKKYRAVVYKRRLALPYGQAMDSLCGGKPLPVRSQIAGEIAYFCEYYQNLRPTVFLSYEREAYAQRDGGDFRVTFDENIRSRREELSLDSEPWGEPLLGPDQVLMEIKTGGGIPLWMAHCLAREQLFRTSFSKYGTAYLKTILGTGKGDLRYA